MNLGFAPAPSIKPYYKNDLITLYCADFKAVLPVLDNGSISSLITDPPYGNTQIVWDRTIDWRFFWSQAGRVCTETSPMVLFACGKFVNQLINSNPTKYRYELIWEKSNVVGFLDANHRPLRNHENILIFGRKFRKTTYNPQFIKGKIHTRAKGVCSGKHYSNPKHNMPGIRTDLYHPRSVLKFQNRTGGQRSVHPTQKPIDLMKWLVRTYSNPGDTILDPFAGSGSTLVAAAIEGRKAIGIEQSKEYCDTIVKRLRENAGMSS